MNSSFEKSYVILICFGFIFTASFIMMFGPSTDFLNCSIYNKNIYSDKQSIKTSKISGKIHINNNWTDAKAENICTGNGTYSNPYIIEDLVIDGGDSDSCIWIENSDVYFRIENCTVYNSRQDYSYAGIRLINVNNSLLINNTCSSNGFGICLYNSNNNTITRNIAINNNFDGIFLYSSDYNNVSQNIVNYNRYGIFFYYSDYNNISRITANNNRLVGIYLYSSDNNNVSRNDVLNNDNNGLYINYYCNNNNISENTINGNSNYGIYLYYGTSTNISKNEINDNQNYGIYLYDGGYNNVQGNVLNNNQFYAMYLYNIEDCTISGNNMTGSYFKIYGSVSQLSSHTIFSNLVEGKFLYYYNNEVNLQPQNFTNAGDIMLVNCRNSLISNISLSKLGRIYLFFSDNNVISGNTVSNQLDYGIEIRYSSDNIISGNNASNNQNAGIYLYESHRNTVSGNTVNNNSEGIYIDYGSENIIHGNIANDNEYSGIFITGYGASASISDNSVSNNYYGIRQYYCDGNTISGNTASFNYYGIYLRYSDDNEITGNTLNNNSVGIYLYNSVNNDISDNVFNGNDEDIVEYRYVGPPPPLLPTIIGVAVIVIICMFCTAIGIYSKRAPRPRPKAFPFEKYRLPEKPEKLEVVQKEEVVVSAPEEQPEEVMPPEPQIIKCPFCGILLEEIYKDAHFCPQCGMELKKKS